MRPLSGALHARRDGLREQERAGEVRVDDLVEVLDRDLLERLLLLAADAARHVDQHVDRAAGRRDDRLDRGLVGDVDLGGADRAADFLPARRISRPRRRSRSQAITSPPFSANATAMAWPMPRAAPATITRLPSNVISISRAARGRFHASSRSRCVETTAAADQIERVRERRAEPVDQAHRDERREAAEDRDRTARSPRSSRSSACGSGTSRRSPPARPPRTSRSGSRTRSAR